MNLIEQLGGHEAVKGFYERAVKHGFELIEIRDALLGYRRANNIFEIGDRIVSTLKGDDFWMHCVCTIEAFHKKMAITNGAGHTIHHYEFRHATPEEIAAGKRLN